MKNSSTIALAIMAGYFLGRRRKLGMAAAVAGAAASGKIGGLASKAIKRGGAVLASSDLLESLSPEVSKVVGTIRGDLADAGRAAAQAAITGRIETLTDSLHERAESLRQPGVGAPEQGGGAEDDQAGDMDAEEARSAKRRVPSPRGRGERDGRFEEPGVGRRAGDGRTSKRARPVRRETAPHGDGHDSGRRDRDRARSGSGATRQSGR